MKLPSIASLFDKSIVTLKRFPLAILAAIIGCLFCILHIHLDYKAYETHQWYWNVAISCYLAMLLQVAIAVFSESKSLSTTIKIILQLIGIALVVAYYFTLPKDWKSSFEQIHVIRLTLFSLGLHWLIAFVPFVATKEINAFWQYNKVLLLRILTSLLYTAVLYAGLSLALLAIDKLFSIHIDKKLYGDLWIVLSGLFNTWFFLAGLPKDFKLLEQSNDYPKGLKVFTQYILLPIITIYLLILYAYMSKIIINWQWPIGWVSYLVLFFSVAGILSLLLIHPIRLQENNKWILTYSRFFYYAIFPLIVLLFFAIKRRISDYGITELRYFVVLLSIWLLFAATYFSVSKVKNIKIIPQSLCFIAFLSSFGPWGVFNVSLKSQEARFVDILTKNHLLVNGKVIKAAKQPSFEDRKQLSSVVSYLVSQHGYNVLQPYYKQNLDSLIKKDSLFYTYAQEKKMLSLLDIDYVSNYENEVDTNKFEYSIIEPKNEKELIETKGYDYLIDLYNFNNFTSEKEIDTTEFTYSDKAVRVSFNQKTNILFLNAVKKKNKPIEIDLDVFVKKLKSAHDEDDNFPEDQMTIAGIDGKTSYKIVIKTIGGKNEGKQINITDIQAKIFFTNL